MRVCLWAVASAAEAKKRRVRKRVRVARDEIRAIVDGGTVVLYKESVNVV
jgi:hypothetical protein